MEYVESRLYRGKPPQRVRLYHTSLCPLHRPPHCLPPRHIIFTCRPRRLPPLWSPPDCCHQPLPPPTAVAAVVRRCRRCSCRRRRCSCRRHCLRHRSPPRRERPYDWGQGAVVLVSILYSQCEDGATRVTGGRGRREGEGEGDERARATGGQGRREGKGEGDGDRRARATGGRGPGRGRGRREGEGDGRARATGGRGRGRRRQEGEGNGRADERARATGGRGRGRQEGEGEC